MDNKGDASSDLGDTAPTVGNRPTRSQEAQWKKHGVLGPPSSIQVCIQHRICVYQESLTYNGCIYVGFGQRRLDRLGWT